MTPPLDGTILGSTDARVKPTPNGHFHHGAPGSRD